MKKLFVLLLALVIVGGAFAQEAAPAVQVTGYVNPGIQFVSNDGATPKQALTFYGQDADKKFRAYLAFSYTDGDFGMFLRVRNDDITADKLSWNRAYVWGKLLNNMVRYDVGIQATGAFGGAADAGFGSWDGQKAAVIRLMPMAGLTLGANIPLRTADDATTADVNETDASKFVFKSLVFGAAYSMEKLFDFVATYDMGGDSKKSDITLGLNVTAVENLTAAFEAKMENSSDSAATTFNADGDVVTGALNTFCESFAYAMGNMTPGLDAYEYMGKDIAMGLSVKPKVTYVMDKTTIDGSFKYSMAQVSGNKDKTDTSMTIAASAKQALGAKATAKAGLSFTPEYKNASDVTVKSVAKVYLDFAYKF